MKNIKLKKHKICDACASGGDITTCQKDVKTTLIDACNRPITYCSKYNEDKNDN